MCVVFMHTYMSECVCVPVFTLLWACLPAGGTAQPWTLQRQRSPDPTQTHTHKNIPHGLRRHVQDTAPQNVSTMDLRFAVVLVGWGDFNPGLPASAPHLLCLQAIFSAWEAGNRGRGSSLEEADLTLAYSKLSLAEVLGHTVIGDPSWL